MTQTKKHLPTSYTLILIGYIIIAGLLASWFTQNFLAERHYREGYILLSISKSAKYNTNPTLRKKLVQDAINHYTKMVNYSPWEPHYQLQLGKAYDEYALLFTLNNRERIIQKTLPIYKKMERQNNNSPWYKSKLHSAYTKLALIEQNPLKKETYQKKALEYAKAAYSADRLNPIFIQLYAQELHKLGQFDEALTLYKKAITIDDRILNIQLNIANIYIYQNKPNLALQEYLSIYEKNPTFNRVGNQIANFYIIVKQPENALLYLEKDYETSPYNLKTLELLGMAHLSLKKWGLAHKYFQEYIDLNPNNFIVIKQDITALNALEKRKKAKKTLRQFIKRHPSHNDAKTLLNTL